LAFHPYPQVIPQFFNIGGFGPPRGLTRASTCPWIDHLASGLYPATRRPVQTRFPYGYGTRLNLATEHNSPAHSSKGTPSLLLGSLPGLAPTVRRHTVSGSLSLPSRGAFHLSLTVLVRYRSPGSVQPWRVVPPDSHGISRAPCYLGSPSGGSVRFAYGTLTLCGRTFQDDSATHELCNSLLPPARQLMGPTTPVRQRHRAITPFRFRLEPVSLTTTSGISVDFSSCGY
jgi:hypothetical protein